MRTCLTGFLVVSMLLGSAALASERPATSQNLETQDKGIGAVTDGEGNPVDLEGSEVQSASRRSAHEPPTAGLRRGRAWWPYPGTLPPYNDVDQRVEFLTEDEIQINGVATLNVRDPQAALGRMPKDLLLDAAPGPGQADGFYLVKIRGVSRNQEQVDALETAGAVLGEYLNINTYIAKVPSAALDAVRALPFVSHVGPYHPAYKISPRIGLEEIPADEALDPASGRERPWELEVVLHKGAEFDGVLDALMPLGLFPRAEETVSSEASTVLFVRSAPEAIPALAKIPGVKWIAERTYPTLFASSSSPTALPMLLQNNGAFTTNTGTGWKLWNAGIDGNASGTAQIVTMMDSGLNTNMELFAQDTVSVGTVGASHRKVVGYDVYGGDQCVLSYSSSDGGHGTWTSQQAVGSISNMTSNPDTTHTPNGHWDAGIARDARVYFQDIGVSTGGINPPVDLGPSIAAAIGKGSYVQNNSWGTASPTYDTIASNLDTALFNNANFVVTVSAGNRGTAGQGTIGSPSTSKNCICVGGADAASPSSLFEDCSWDGAGACGGANDLGSSRGPVTTSNRTKPDILGYMAFSATVGGEAEAGSRPLAMCQNDATKNVYWDWVNVNGFGGTSFSAPEVAGLAALVRDYFLAGYYPTGVATPANALIPSGALVKAMILASGEDMAAVANPSSSITVAKRYSNDVGYGRANLPAVLHIGSGAPFLWVQNSDALGDGATRTFFYNINGNATPLRVMMVYYDAAGNALQKDCDLKVTIGSSVYWGNNFSGGWSTAATSTRDHTNNTEGVFLDAAHGLPASGTVQVDVIGFNNPGGMNYSLVVVGDVASQNVTQVSLEKGKYTCAETVRVTVNDAGASSPVSVTLTSRNAGSTVIDTQTVTCTGSGGVFTGTIQTGSGIVVADGGSLTATYNTTYTASATVACQATLADGGFIIDGGCDNAAAGTDEVAGPLFNGGSNEFYNKYLDAGEYSSYTFGFVNQTGRPLTDALVSLSFSGPGAARMSVLNNPVHIGSVPTDALAGAVFQVYTDPTTSGLTSVNLDFDVTSPGDGYTTPRRVSQVQLLQTNDAVSRQMQCSPFSTSGGAHPALPSPWYESAVAGRALNPWRFSGNAAAPATVGSETRTDGMCGSATANAAVMVGNSGTTTAGVNFAVGSDSVLLQNFQPALRGNAGNGQPYHYVWKWHSFYKASELLGNQGGAWRPFYNDQWNSAVNPTGDQATAFPITLPGYYYHTVFDYVGPWNWETANTGTPDDPRLGPSSGGAPNQIIISFTDVTGLATSGTWFAYGHEHLDDSFFGGAGANRDIALDNENLVYDQYYAAAQAGASCGGGGQVGQVAFDQFAYANCPSGPAVISVLDANAVSPIQVVVTSPGTGDSETVTLTGTAPYFSGTLSLSTGAGLGSNNGVLFVLPEETLSASYSDGSPAGSSTAQARTACSAGSLVYVSSAQIVDNGDNDGIADNGETVTLDITIRNNTAAPLANARVKIFSDTPNVDCISDAEALYGSVAVGASATNPPGDRFTFHVAPTVACSDWQNPPPARFTVLITADGIDGPSSLQTFTIPLDLDATASGGSYSYTQSFAADPGWGTGATPDDDGTCANPYSNSFHWCAACGNAGGGFGAWTGNSAFGTSGQNYPNLDSSTLYSPVFTANGTVTLQFDVAYRTETGWDGAIVQYRIGAGAWTTLGYTTPAQSSITQTSCSPLLTPVTAWHGNGVSWTTTNAASVAAAVGQSIQFRWRLGSDETANGSGYGGLGVDNVVITGLKQTLVCEPTRNSGLPPCDRCANVTCVALDPCHLVGVCDPGTGLCSNPPAPNGTPCDDGNACTTPDSCTSGACGGAPVPPPAEASGVRLSGLNTQISWSPVAGATSYGLVRGLLGGLPVGPGGADEQCLGSAILGTSTNDAAIPGTASNGFWYLVRGQSACGTGSWGSEGLRGAPGAARATSTCP